MKVPASSALRRLLAPCALAASLAGCADNTDPAAPSSPVDGGVTASACDDPDPGPAVPLPRLSGVQYVNTVHDLLFAVLPAADAQSVYGVLAASLGSLPQDRRVGPSGATHGGYQRLDQDVQDARVSQTYDLAVAIGQQLTATPERITALAGSCATDNDPGNDVACLRSFVQHFGARALRRPLGDDDVAFYSGAVAGVAAADLADLVAIFLTSPQFLYHVEHGDTLLRSALYTLSPYEVAARLSFHLWDTSPDDELIAAAQSGALSTAEGYARQVARLASNAHAVPVQNTFFREYLWLDEVANIDTHVGDTDYRAFAGAQLPTTTLTDEMTAEVSDAAVWVVQHGGTLDDVVSDRRTYARTPLVAAIYNTPIWDGTSEPPLARDPERAGLITRAAFLTNPALTTRPIMKGVFLREGLLCDTIPPPPGNASMTPFPNLGIATTRQVVSTLTEGDGTVCAGCHKQLINPLGFATEGFDSLGRVRTMQTFYNPFSGAVTGQLPIDTSSVPQVLSGDKAPSSGPADLTGLLLKSGKVHSCFARQILRYALSRPEDTTADQCLLDHVGTALSAHQPLAQVLQLTALRPEFRRRNF